MTKSNTLWTPRTGLKWSSSGRPPHCGGVYLFFSGYQVLYIGMARNLSKRITAHQANPWFRGYSEGKSLHVQWAISNRPRLDEVALIQHFLPPLNGRRRGRKVGKGAPTVEEARIQRHARRKAAIREWNKRFLPLDGTPRGVRY